jgi:hypothetical protein
MDPRLSLGFAARLNSYRLLSEAREAPEHSRHCRENRLMRLSIAVALLVPAIASTADIVLLDEFWTPELQVTEVRAEEIDALVTGVADQTSSGEFSLRLTNEAGAPSIRVAGATRLALAEIPVEESDAVIHYRTDSWNGTWRLEIWVHDHGVTAIPVKVLEASLDAGDAGGALVADDGWHEARGVLRATGEYDSIPQDDWCSVYVWLVPESGWDVPHTTYVDLVEIDVLTGPSSESRRAPAHRVRPSPGAYTVGNGWVWIEGENAVSPIDPGVHAHRIDYADRQALLSGGDWAEYAPGNTAASYEFKPPEPGEYTLWCRGCLGPGVFRWRIGEGEWREVSSTGVLDRVMFRDWMGAWWFTVGKVNLVSEPVALEIDGRASREAAAIDCWLFTRHDQVPRGAQKPWRP